MSKNIKMGNAENAEMMKMKLRFAIKNEGVWFRP